MSSLVRTSKRKDRQSITFETKIEIINKKDKEHKSDTEFAILTTQLLAILFENS